MAASVVNAGSEDVEAVDDHEQVETVSSDQQQEAQTDDDDDDDEEEDDDKENSRSDLPFPLYASKAFYVLNQTTAPRRWCLQLITSPYPFHLLFSLVERTLGHIYARLENTTIFTKISKYRKYPKYHDIFDILNKLYNNGCSTLMQYLMTIGTSHLYLTLKRSFSRTILRYDRLMSTSLGSWAVCMRYA